MSVIAFIPVRGGSKSIPLKNIKPFCGKPLVCWNIEALDTASTESVMLEYIHNANISEDNIFMLVQVTSPLTPAKKCRIAISSPNKMEG